jgi:hypothetical protein
MNVWMAVNGRRREEGSRRRMEYERRKGKEKRIVLSLPHIAPMIMVGTVEGSQSCESGWLIIGSFRYRRILITSLT